MCRLTILVCKPFSRRKIRGRLIFSAAKLADCRSHHLMGHQLCGGVLLAEQGLLTADPERPKGRYTPHHSEDVSGVGTRSPRASECLEHGRCPEDGSQGKVDFRKLLPKSSSSVVTDFSTSQKTWG